MGSELMLGGFGSPERRRGGGLARQSRGQREVQHRADISLMELVNDGRHNEVRAMIRKRFTEDGMQDIKDVGGLAQELAGNDPFIASLLVPIVQEFARTTARDIRDFGRARGM